MKLSIIIPVYKTQDTLDRCLQSVLQQSFTDYEIILVDDESPDDCSKLCDEYAQKDEKIKVFHKKNGGLSDARNFGIRQVKGEYITFIDSDDAIAPNTLQHIMDELTTYPQVDILEYPILERVGNKHKEHLLTFAPKVYQNPIDYWLAERTYLHTYACNKVFKRNLFEKVLFPQGKTFEDVLTIPKLIGIVPFHDNEYVKPVIRITDKGQYLYYWNSNSITAKAKSYDFQCLYEGHNRTLLYVFEKIEDNKDLIIKYQYPIQEFMVQILNMLLYIYELSGKYEDNPPVIHYVEKLGKVVKIKDLKLRLLNLLGYHNLCRLNRIIHRIYRHR